MNDEILKEQIELAINNLNSTDEKEIKEINNLIEEIDNVELKSELSILFTLKQVELSNQQVGDDSKEIIRKPIAKKTNKVNVKVLVLAGALGLGSIIGGIKLIKRDNSNNDNTISTSYSQESNNETKGGLFEPKVYHTDVVFNDSVIGTQGFENTYNGTQHEFDVHYGLNLPNTDTTVLELHTCPKNYYYDSNEVLLINVKQYFDDNGIEVKEMHHYPKEELKKMQSDYDMKELADRKPILRECGNDLEKIYIYINGDLFGNQGFMDWIEGKEYLRYNNSLYSLFSLGVSTFYPLVFEREINEYMLENNCSEQKAWDDAKEKFLNDDLTGTSYNYFSPYQVQREEDYKYTLFLEYIKEVGLDQFKEDFIYLFDDNYYQGIDGKVYTK